jgi:hypothetical protein
MDVQVISTLVGSLGFPIVVTGYLLMKVVPSMDGLKEAVNNNTTIIQRLLDKE